MVDHPLVKHKLTLMRKAETSTASFRNLLSEISMLLAYEATRDMKLRDEEIEPRIEPHDAACHRCECFVMSRRRRTGGQDRKQRERTRHPGSQTTHGRAPATLSGMR